MICKLGDLTDNAERLENCTHVMVLPIGKAMVLSLSQVLHSNFDSLHGKWKR